MNKQVNQKPINLRKNNIMHTASDYDKIGLQLLERRLFGEQKIMSPDDNTLIKQFLEGDDLSFEMLVEKYKKKVFYTAYFICKNYDYSYDIAQEVFIKVYEKLKGFKMKSSFYTWLYRISVNHTFNYIRKMAKSDRQLSFDESIKIPIVHKNTPVQAMTRQELSSTIENAIDLLPEKQKLVFILRNYDGLSFSDIAQVTKRTEGATKANYFHAVRNLRKKLTAEGVSHEM